MRPIASCASSTAETSRFLSAVPSSVAVLKLHCDLATSSSRSFVSGRILAREPCLLDRYCCLKKNLREASAATPFAQRHQGCVKRVEVCDIGLTGPAQLRSLEFWLLPGTGNAQPRMVLTTQRSEAPVSP